MFSVGDMVVYGGQGVCKITTVEKKKIAGEMKEYFVLKPVYDERNTIFVPLDNEALFSRLHKILTVDEAKKLIRDIPEEASIWVEKETERKECYKKIISGGDRGDISRMVKTLRDRRETLKDSGKKLHSADERFLKEGVRLLCDEMAVVLSIEPKQVLELIRESIAKCSNA